MIRRLMFAAVLVPALFCVAAYAQSADEVVNKSIEARGGLEKLRAIKTVTMNGTATLGGPGGSLQAPFSMKSKRPGQMRMEITIQGQSLVQATDGKTPWTINPFQGSPAPEKMSEDDAKDAEQQADIDGPLVDYKAKGNTVELLGKEDFEGTEVYKLKVTLKGGGIQYIYLDASTYLEIKETTKRSRNGQEFEVETLPSDYKEVNGVLFPFSIQSKVNGTTQFELTLDSIDANKDVEDAIFVMPTK